MKKPLSVFARLLALFLALAAALQGRPAAAQTCDRSGCGRASCATPAKPVPEDRWGGLRPLDVSIPLCTNQKPLFCRDSTGFNEFTQIYANYPWFMSLDAENGYLFVALSHGLQVWDARSFPPEPKSQLSSQAFPVWSSNPEIKWPLQDVDAPPGVDDVAAVAGHSGIGLAVIGLANKSEPKILYQSHKKEGNQVYAARIGGRDYAFLAAPAGEPSGGLFAYDMTQAKLYDRCVESVPAAGETVHCPGVYLGRIGSQPSATYVDGVDRWVVASFGSARGFQIWDVANPSAPQLELSGLGDRQVDGVALWKEGSAYYLAARTAAFEPGPGRVVHRTAIYDVSCIASVCPGLGAPLWSGEFNGGGTADFLTFSRSDGIPFLYLGSDDRCSGGTQREWLLDVSNPAAPQDISPFNYWGWYYRGGPTGFNLVTPRVGKFVGPVFYRAALSLFDFHQRTGLTGGGGAAIDVDGPNTGQAGQALTFTAAATGGCSPNPNGWTWTAGDGTFLGPATGATVSVSWPSAGSRSVSARNSACGSAVGIKGVTILGSGALTASFTFSPNLPRTGQAVTFDGSASSGGPSQYSWDFGDGTIALGQVVTHAYALPGAYTVLLTVTRPGSGSGCVAGTCSDATQRTVVVVADAPPPPNASFQTSAPCVSQFGFDQCRAEPGMSVSFTANSTSGASYAWDFGDGTTASGRSVTHSWTQQGIYTVSLTVSNGQTTDTRTKTFEISASGPPPGPGPGPGPGALKTILLPWIAQARKPAQSSDLYIHNPGSLPVSVALEFRRRGTPEANPPRQNRTIAPGATLALADALKTLFGLQDASGFLLVEPQGGDAEPVVVLLNTIPRKSSRVGQALLGVELGGTVPAVQLLTGLNTNSERFSYFGVTNPNPAPATYRLRFFNAAGREIGHSADLALPAFSQRQFQPKEIQRGFGLSGSDYRVQVETISGGPLYPYGTNVRSASSDPTFVAPQVPDLVTTWLIGVQRTPGARGALVLTDLVLANPGAQPLRVDVTFTSASLTVSPTGPVSITLQPGETRRIVDALNSLWGIANATGVLAFASREPSGALPVVQAETYDNARPPRRVGQWITPVGALDLADPGQGQYLTGLRQDGSWETTLWLFNPSGSPGLYDLVYRALDGTVRGRIDGFAVPAGGVLRIAPNQHSLPAAGVPGGFTVQVLVRSGKLLAAAQVTDKATGDPAYVLGETR
ncbi:MAG TPA: PKD domain-containing protein [Thermoanaerobaculia bacterium]|jgi:PKD repeat protein